MRISNRVVSTHFGPVLLALAPARGHCGKRHPHQEGEGELVARKEPIQQRLEAWVGPGGSSGGSALAVTRQQGPGSKRRADGSTARAAGQPPFLPPQLRVVTWSPSASGTL
jgi:hypothetical protein